VLKVKVIGEPCPTAAVTLDKTEMTTSAQKMGFFNCHTVKREILEPDKKTSRI